MLKKDVRKLVIDTVFRLAVFNSHIAADHCKLYSLSNDYIGRYCPANGTVTVVLSPLQCRYSCIQSTTCNAYNYDTRERTCTHLPSPCPLAFANTMMEFMVFTEKPVHQCYQWRRHCVLFSHNDDELFWQLGRRDNPNEWWLSLWASTHRGGLYGFLGSLHCRRSHPPQSCRLGAYGEWECGVCDEIRC